MRITLLVVLVLAGCGNGRIPGRRIVDPQICNASCEAGSACDSDGQCRPICSIDTQCGGCDVCADGLCAQRACDANDTPIPGEPGPETPADDNTSAATTGAVVPIQTRVRMASDSFAVEANTQSWIGESASTRFRISPRK